MDTPKPSQVVFTNKARCRDCYRCLRVCPVKAIGMRDGQAFVVEDRCIACGTCIRECPQGAKSFRSDLERAQRLIDSGAPVAASVAPSFVAVFGPWQRRRLSSALRKLGFAFIGETAVGAFHVARKTAEVVAEHADRPHICSACPAVVNYIERYQSRLVDCLVPVVSPMIAHARLLKQRLGEGSKVVFIGPCVAKKAEADRPEHQGAVDCVLTFEELHQWLERRDIRLEGLEESEFDEQPMGEARYFPLAGGAARTAGLGTDLLDTRILAVTGAHEVAQKMENLAAEPRPVFIEALFCPQGCVNGPAIASKDILYHRRTEVLDFASGHPGPAPSGEIAANLQTAYRAFPIFGSQPVTEAQIQQVLERTGKARPEDQLNCGACGYASCRDKAVAIFLGMAEPEMCIPRMKRLAEQRTDRIIETSPNGIVILDEHLVIIHMNQAFRRFFMCSPAVIGKRIGYLMDPEPFERLEAGEAGPVDLTVSHDKYGLVCRQILYPLKEERQYVGIFVNITTTETSQRKLDSLRQQTVTQARELLENQIGMAQKIAQYLGESTARSQELMENLVRQAMDQPAPGPGAKGGPRAPRPKDAKP